MKPRLFLCAAGLLLSACGSVVNESTSSINVDGRSYELRSRTIQGANGSYDTSSVRVNGVYYQCLPASPGSCEGAVREGLFNGDR